MCICVKKDIYIYIYIEREREVIAVSNNAKSRVNFSSLHDCILFRADLLHTDEVACEIILSTDFFGARKMIDPLNGKER